MFAITRNRDVWKGIRGFVFQVALTNERWLELGDPDVLELERGEDIDLIARALDAEGDEPSRLLEQVKHLESNITLRFPAVVSAIANAVDHIEANPGLLLSFLFSTTAGIGLEQQSTLRREPGLRVWEQIRSGAIGGDALAEKLRGIRDLLRSASRPADLPGEVWEKFLRFLRDASDGDLAALMRRFQWVTGLPNRAADSSALEGRLIELGHAANAAEARVQHDRMFVHVFRRLSQPGIKRLTRQELLTVLSEGALTTRDAALLQSLRTGLAELEGRVGVLETATMELQSSVRTLEQRSEIYSTTVSAELPMLEVPPLVHHVAQRDEAVNAVLAQLQRVTWTALHGAILSGKTQLSVLVCERHGDCRAWLRFQGLSESESAGRLDDSLVALAGESPMPGQRKQWLDRLMVRLGTGALLVLDALPRITPGSTLAEKLDTLARSAAASGVRILSTSAEPLPSTVLSTLPPDVAGNLPIPAFSAEDTRELLTAMEAPPASQMTGVLHPQTLWLLGQGNVALIAMLAAHARTRGWVISGEWIQETIQGTPTQALTEEVLLRLASAVTDERSKELLYRLTLVTGRFGWEEVQAVASAPPPVEHPRERLQTLLGPWIQVDGNDRMSVSPLAVRLGRGNLADPVARRCHFQLGRTITARREITLHEALMAVTHYVSSGAEERAALLLARALASWLEQQPSKGGEELFLPWATVPLSETIDLGIRVYLRSTQVAAFHHAGKDTDFLLGDLETLLLQLRPEDTWVLLAAAILAVPAIIGQEPARGYAIIGRILRRAPNLRLPDGAPVLLPEGVTLEMLMWAHFNQSLSPAHIRGWMDVFTSLTKEQRDRLLAGPLGAMGAMTLVGKPILFELNKPEGEQDWNAIEQLLADVAEEARRLGSEVLWANALRARMIVLTDYRDDIAAAIELAERAQAELGDDPNTRFILTEHIGEKLYEKEQREEARTWLVRSIEGEPSFYPDLRLAVFLRLSWIAGDSDAQSAAEFAARAASAAEEGEIVLELDRARAQGELAVALWLAGDLPGALRAWDRAMEALFATKSDSAEWRESAVMFGHVSGFFAHLSQWGKAPERLLNGDSYAPPARHNFFAKNPRLIELFNAELAGVLHVQMATIAETQTEFARAEEWRAKALTLTRRDERSVVLAFLHLDHLPALIEQERFAEVIEFSVEAGIVIAGGALAHTAGRMPVRGAFDFTSELGSPGSPGWERADKQAALNALDPIALHLFRRSLADRPAAATQAAEVARLCSERSATFPQRAAFWRDAAGVFKTMLASDATAQSLARQGADFIQRGEDQLASLCYLASSLAPDAALTNSLRAHLAVLPVIEPRMRVHLPTYRKLLCPFFHDFWTGKLSRSRFDFGMPATIERSLVEASFQPAARWLPMFFDTLAVALGVSLSQKGKEWVDDARRDGIQSSR